MRELERGQRALAENLLDEALNTVIDKLKYYRDTLVVRSIAYGWGTAGLLIRFRLRIFFDVVIGTPNGVGIGPPLSYQNSDAGCFCNNR